MGLDFYGFYLEKGETIEDYFNFSWSKQKNRELFYARKGWELVYALNCHNHVSKLELSDWINLMEILYPIGPYLEEIQNAFNGYCDNKRGQKLKDTYIKWFDANFDEPPQLDYDFSVGYMLNFWNAADVVIEYLEDPDYEVWMFASY